jgi:pimeloyl-ACP methyl ester carboxylesterase
MLRASELTCPAYGLVMRASTSWRKGLQTALSVPPFDRCDVIAVAAHSMGGLVAQRAILNDASLTDRLSHLFLFGTPSSGLKKAWFGSLFKPQLADMSAGGPFVAIMMTRISTPDFPETASATSKPRLKL